MIPSFEEEYRTKLLPSILALIRSSIEDGRQQDEKLGEKLNSLTDKFTINGLKIESMLHNLDERETLDIDHLASSIAKDSHRDLILTTTSLVLIALLVFGTLIAKWFAARMREPARDNRRSKTKAKRKNQDSETDEDRQEA